MRDDAQIVIWHGQSASDQLALRRVAYHLRNAPQRLNEARLSERDLPLIADADGKQHRRGRKDGATAVGMFTAEELLAKLPSAAPISVLRIGRLALEWQEAKHMNAQTRRWHDNTFVSGSFADIDEAILDAVTADWQPARRIAGEVMGADFGFMVSDSVAFWRCRELAAAGRLKLRGEPGDIVHAELRRQIRRFQLKTHQTFYQWPAPERPTTIRNASRSSNSPPPNSRKRATRALRWPILPPRAARRRRVSITITRARKRSSSTCSTATRSG